MAIDDRRDANEAEIIAELERQGWDVTRQDRWAGFDLLAVRGSRSRIIEVKNPRTRWKLTAREVAKQAAVESAGAEYEIVLYSSQI